MKKISLFLAILTLNSITVSHARTLQHKDFPTDLAEWKITATHRDTGEVERCTAEGLFDGLKVSIQLPADKKHKGDITFRYSRDGIFDRQTRTDERSCGDGKTDAPAGTWRYNPKISTDEICDGKEWRRISSGHFKDASLLIQGKATAKSVESASYKADLRGGKSSLYEYVVWFEAVADLEAKLASTKKWSLRIKEKKLKPIELPEMGLKNLIAPLQKCARPQA